MKKIFSCMAAALMAVSMFAEGPELPAIESLKASEVEDKPGNAVFVWKADATVSAGYVIEFGQIESAEPYTQRPIGHAALLATACAVPGYDGYFGTSTQYIMTYGVTYASLEAKQAPETQLAIWREGWMNYVNATDLTLKDAYYYAIVTGYDAELENITETKAVTVFQIGSNSQGIVEVTNIAQPVKFLRPDGQIYIQREGKTYTPSGALIR